MRQALIVAMLLWGSLAVAQSPPIPTPDSPLRLLDLRWLARPMQEAPFLIDAWIAPPAEPPSEGDLRLIAEVDGPGVMQHLMLTPQHQWILEVDGNVIYDGTPGDEWRQTANMALQSGPGERPWAWPLAQLTGADAQVILPIPFVSKVRILSKQAQARLWLAGLHLSHPPERRFGDDRWRAELDRAIDHLGAIHTDTRSAPPVESWQGLTPLPGTEVLPVSAYTPPAGRANLFTRAGAGEIVGMRFELRPSFFNRLRYLVVEITTDQAEQPAIRLPLIDLVGSMYPFFRGWAFTHGTWVAGLQHPAWHQPWAVAWFRLPIPFADGIRIDLLNRHPDLPLQVDGRIQLSPLSPEEAAVAWRLSGHRHDHDLPMEEGESLELMRFAAEGRLAMLSFLSTGHQRLYHSQWPHRIQLSLHDGDDVAASGFPFFPLGRSPFNAKPITTTWSHVPYDEHDIMGGSRTYWVAPQPLSAGGAIHYAAGGSDGPAKAESATLWYQPVAVPAPALATAPAPLPTRWNKPLAAVAPGGWSEEAEELLPHAIASGGDVYVERRIALDAQASGDAALAWNPPAMGDTLDLLVLSPPTPYVMVKIRPLSLPGGGRFGVWLLPVDHDDVIPLWAPGDRDFLARVLGRIDLPYPVDCYQSVPFQHQLHNVATVCLRNPSPDDLVRLRFVAAGGRGTGQLLAVDQITMNPAPPSPVGWHEMADLPPIWANTGITAVPMEVGRLDFHGGGGMRLHAAASGSLRLRLLDPTAPRNGTWEVRGLVESGQWSLQSADGALVSLGQSGKEPVVWTLPSSSSQEQDLIIECAPGGGTLLLDSWRLTTPQP